MSSTPNSNQQLYCLRWNNHRSNLLTVFDQLLQNEAFTDVTLACEGGTSVKCHKMVLAACSSYFQCLFTELPCRHPVVVLKDVRYGEMKAILEYMYRGEVNVAQDQLAALLKVAEALKVKGLVEENTSQIKTGDEEGNAISTSSAPPSAPSSSNMNSREGSPPHSSTGAHQGFPKSSYPYGKSPVDRSDSRMSSLPIWPITGLSMPTPPSTTAHTAAAVLNRCYEAVTADMPPLRRKKLSSLLMSRDTPILRTVLGQGQADSSQPVPLLCRPDSYGQGNHSPFTNGSGHDASKNIKAETSEESPSPYTDISLNEDDVNERQSKGNIHSSMPHSIYSETKGSVSSVIATYVPTPKPEWKRYKQYTRNDIMSAIEAVRSGMSALQAARKFGVPSRTLYDKVKKLGITTSRPFRRSSNTNGSPAFPYGISGTNTTTYGSGEEEINYNSGIIEHGFWHHALEAHNSKQEGMIKQEMVDREAVAAMVPPTSGGDNISGSPQSPQNNERSPSPNMIKFADQNNVSPMSPNQMEEDSNQVEDLSVSRKPEAPQNSRVIMPPMSQATSMITVCSDAQEGGD